MRIPNLGLIILSLKLKNIFINFLKLKNGVSSNLHGLKIEASNFFLKKIIIHSKLEWS